VRAFPVALLAALSACSRTELFDEGTSSPGAVPPFDAGTISPADASNLSDDAGIPPVPLDASVLPGLVLFGGLDSNGSVLGDTWVFRGGQWVKQDVSGPSPRAFHLITSWGAGALLFSGGAPPSGPGDPGASFDDTWEWDGRSWRQLASSSPAHLQAMAGLGGKVVGYGSDGNTAGVAAGITWEWDGVSWTELKVASPIGGMYGETYDVMMATVGDHVLWVGNKETWSWDGLAWTQLSVPSPITADGAMAALGSTVLLYGGQFVFYPVDVVPGDTIVWNGAGWAAPSVTGPPGRMGMAMAATFSNVVLFGGGAPSSAPSPGPASNLADTWSWDGTAWTQLAIPGPPGRVRAGMAAFQGSPAP
jgi:hypothetical protein